MVLGRLEGSVGELSVVNDDGIAFSTTLLVSPANALRKNSILVGKEELRDELVQEFRESRRVVVMVCLRCHHP